MAEDHTASANPTEVDRSALLRCYECSDDEQDTDIGRPMLDRLVAIGWLDKVARDRWEISPEGDVVLKEIQNERL